MKLCIYIYAYIYMDTYYLSIKIDVVRDFILKRPIPIFRSQQRGRFSPSPPESNAQVFFKALLSIGNFKNISRYGP